MTFIRDNLKFDNPQNRNVFYGILILKCIIGVLFCAYPMRQWFIPFVEYFVTSGLRSPWDYFFALGQYKAFPYGPVMLIISAIPFLILYPLRLLGLDSVFLSTFAFTSIVVFFDFVIYGILRKIFPHCERKIIFLYWASPILFYINYYHHQLDVIPVALLMLSLIFLMDKRILLSGVILGLGLATKLNLLIAAPFILFYLFRSNLYKRLTIPYACVFILTYVACVLPVVFTRSFQKMVLAAPEQGWIFDMLIPFGIKGISLLIGPFFIFLVLLNFASYERVNTDILIMFIGLVFMLLVTFIAPMPGWYMWSFPFIVYAFLKYHDFPRLPIYMVTFGYLLYFLLNSESTFLDSWALIAPGIANFSFNNALSDFLKIKPALFDSVLFVPLVSTMFYLSSLMFTLGAKSNRLYSFRRRPYFIGIGGDSATGKHTLVSFLKQVFGERLVTQVNSDDYHRWERGHPMYKVYTHLHPAANELNLQFLDASFLRSGRRVEKVTYEHGKGIFSVRQTVKPGTFVIFVGLHPFYFPRMRRIFDFKIFMDPEENLRKEWKIKRDSQERGYTTQEVLDSIEKRLPDAERFIRPQRRFADLIISYAQGRNKNYRVTYEFSDEYNVESVISNFQINKNFPLEYAQDPRYGNQRLIVEGDVAAPQLGGFINKYISEYNDILSGDIHWQQGVDGFTQFIVLHLFSQKVAGEL